MLHLSDNKKSDTISSEQKPDKGVKEKCHQVNSTSSQKVVCTEGESRKEGTQTCITHKLS